MWNVTYVIWQAVVVLYEIKAVFLQPAETSTFVLSLLFHKGDNAHSMSNAHQLSAV
jgi:hypothetical protein